MKKAQESPLNIIVYEADVFPGVRIRVRGVKGALTLYRSGQFLILGMCVVQEAIALLQILYPCVEYAKV